MKDLTLFGKDKSTSYSYREDDIYTIEKRLCPIKISMINNSTQPIIFKSGNPPTPRGHESNDSSLKNIFKSVAMIWVKFVSISRILFFVFDLKSLVTFCFSYPWIACTSLFLPKQILYICNIISH